MHQRVVCQPAHRCGCLVEAMVRGATGLVLASALVPVCLAAQVEQPSAYRPVFRSDLYFFTVDRWRGIVRNAHPVAQADAMTAVVLGSVSLSVGGWTSVELQSTAAEPRPDLRSGPAGPSQWSAWGQLAMRTGPVLLAAGALRDTYVRPDADPAVLELYASAQMPSGRWTPSLSLWQAIDGAHGLYLEPAIRFDHFVSPFSGPAVAWSTTLRGGIQVGLRSPDAGPTVPGPESTGLTFVALASLARIGVTLTGGLMLVVTTGPELQYSRDPAARRRGDGSDGNPFVFMWPIQLGLSFPLTRPQ
jgi:hypothetical protein